MRNAARLAAGGLRAKKSFGQNFVEDASVLRRIAEACLLQPEAPVTVEIGAGLGALTAALRDAGAHVLAVERDRDLVPLLTARFANDPHVEVLEANALTLDFPALHARHGPLTLCGNLPYHLTSPLLFRALEFVGTWRRMVVMVQREVADRMAAPPGNRTYGLLTVRLGGQLEMEKVLDVPPGAFHPRPKVSSAVVVLKPRPAAIPGSELPQFPAVVRAAFGARRKTLRNGLKALTDQPDRWLAHAGIDGGVRAETLDVAAFGRLAAAAAVYPPERPLPPGMVAAHGEED